MIGAPVPAKYIPLDDVKRNCMSFVFNLPNWTEAPVYTTEQQHTDWLLNIDQNGEKTCGLRTEPGVEAIYWPRYNIKQDFHWAVYTNQGWAHKQGNFPSQLLGDWGEEKVISEMVLLIILSLLNSQY